MVIVDLYWQNISNLPNTEWKATRNQFVNWQNVEHRQCGAVDALVLIVWRCDGIDRESFQWEKRISRCRGDGNDADMYVLTVHFRWDQLRVQANDTTHKLAHTNFHTMHNANVFVCVCFSWTKAAGWIGGWMDRPTQNKSSRGERRRQPHSLMAVSIYRWWTNHSSLEKHQRTTLSMTIDTINVAIRF